VEGSRFKKLVYPWILIASLVVSFACVAYPVYVIQPFRRQGPRELAAALAIIQRRSPVEALCALIALAGLAWYWRLQEQRRRRLLAATGALFICAFAVLSHVNIYELMFHPDTHPLFMAAAQAKVEPDDKVLAVKLGSSARAYPIRSIAYHHIINDVVGGVPIVATY
jgi:hypothetical protein